MSLSFYVMMRQPYPQDSTPSISRVAICTDARTYDDFVGTLGRASVESERDKS